MSVSFAPNIEKAFDALQLWVAETQARVEELEREVFLLQQDTHIATREGDTPEVRRKALADAEAALRVREVLGRVRAEEDAVPRRRRRDEDNG